MTYRRVRKNHTTRLPGAVILVDTESYQREVGKRAHEWEYPLRLGVAKYFRLDRGKPSDFKRCVFTYPEVFWSWVYSLANRERPIWIFAHNLGWDMSVLRMWRELEEGRLSLVGPERTIRKAGTNEKVMVKTPGMLVTADPPTMFKTWTRGDACIKGVDTFNWFPVSLAKLGEWCGVPKLPMPSQGESNEQWTEYCEQDVEILFAAVLKLFAFIRDNDCGVFKYTPASQSVALFRHRCMDCEWSIHDNKYVRGIERSSYYGGRNAVYFKGEIGPKEVFRLRSDNDRSAGIPYHHCASAVALDMNAAYASVMHKRDYPNDLVKVEREISPQDALGCMAYYCGIGTVKIQTESEPYPVRRNGHVIWATGRFTTALPGPELTRALVSRHVKWVNELALYKPVPMFTEFVESVVGMEKYYRHIGDELCTALCKQIRNSLHGKMGQHGYRWEVVPDEKAPDPWGHFCHLDADTGEIKRMRAVGWTVQQLHTESDAPDTSVAIAAYVTSYCREMMRSLRMMVGKSNVFYEDADSIHVSKDGFDILYTAGCIGKNMGQLKIANGPVEYAHYRSLKDYTFGDSVICGGLPRNAHRDDRGQYWCDEFSRTNDIISKPPPKGPRVVRRQVVRPVHSLFAEETQTGWTRPINLNEWEPDENGRPVAD